MNKEWVAQQEAEHEKKIAEARQILVSKIESSDLFTSDQKKRMLSHLEETDKSVDPINRIDFDLISAAIDSYDEAYDVIMEFRRGLNLHEYFNMLHMRGRYRRYLDSNPMEFNGDIIITDPCYICKKWDTDTMPKRSEFDDHESYSIAVDKWYEENPRHWSLCECGYNMEVFGITNYMTRDTLYGDWSCTTYNSDTKEKIGNFCADAGLVSVFLLDEVLRYNPEFDYHKNREWTTTWIPDFKGTVQFVVEREEGVYEDDTDWHKSGEKWVDYAVKVVGHGINKLTGEAINFITSQTGL